MDFLSEPDNETLLKKFDFPLHYIFNYYAMQGHKAISQHLATETELMDF